MVNGLNGSLFCFLSLICIEAGSEINSGLFAIGQEPSRIYPVSLSQFPSSTFPPSPAPFQALRLTRSGLCHPELEFQIPLPSTTNYNLEDGTNPFLPYVASGHGVLSEQQKLTFESQKTIFPEMKDWQMSLNQLQVLCHLTRGHIPVVAGIGHLE